MRWRALHYPRFAAQEHAPRYSVLPCFVGRLARSASGVSLWCARLLRPPSSCGVVLCGAARFWGHVSLCAVSMCVAVVALRAIMGRSIDTLPLGARISLRRAVGVCVATARRFSSRSLALWLVWSAPCRSYSHSADGSIHEDGPMCVLS